MFLQTVQRHSLGETGNKLPFDTQSGTFLLKIMKTG